MCVCDEFNKQSVLTNPTLKLQSIKEQNFRYMGARLCQLLDSLDDSPSSVLRQLLSMKMEHQQSELLIYLQQEQIKVRGTTLFLAELYMQLRKPHVSLLFVTKFNCNVLHYDQIQKRKTPNQMCASLTRT